VGASAVVARAARVARATREVRVVMVIACQFGEGRVRSLTLETTGDLTRFFRGRAAGCGSKAALAPNDTCLQLQPSIHAP
jgi:hypothetical protein